MVCLRVWPFQRKILTEIAFFLIDCFKFCLSPKVLLRIGQMTSQSANCLGLVSLQIKGTERMVEEGRNMN